jgi:hypothetical protein
MIPKTINNVRSRLMLLFHWRNIGRVSLRPLLTVDPDRPNRAPRHRDRCGFRKTLSLTIPATLLFAADEVIE